MDEQTRQTPNTQTRHFPCSSCGAKLEFSPGTKELKCPYCNHPNQIQQSADVLEELDFYDYFARVSEAGETEVIQTVKCEACGATSTLQPDISMSHCPFCGSQLHAPARADRLIRPGGVIPFQITRNSAMKQFRGWLGTLWFAPGGLKNQATREGGIKGFYIPWWTFDAESTTWYEGERGDDYYLTESYTDTDSSGKVVTRTRQVRHTRWSNASGTVQKSFDDLLVLAGHSLPTDLLESLKPWAMQELVPYQDAYMSGFQAEAYQVGLGDGFELARKEMDTLIRRAIEENIGGDHQRIHTAKTDLDQITFKLILLPVWISAYRYKGKSYRFLINGSTGKVQGERPWSVAKITGAVILAVVIVALIIMLSR